MKYINYDNMKLLKNRGTGLFPKSLFILFSLVGFIAIWNMKSHGVSQTLTAFTPVCFIVGYCLLACQFRAVYLSEEKIGDNAYYLGFLYTLSSLSYALYAFTANDSASEQMINSFSVALWSTIAGIAARVFLSQLRQDPNDIEKEARKKIAETATFLTTELHQSAIAFTTYRNSIDQTLKESTEKVNQDITEIISNSVTRITSSSNEASLKINTYFEDITSNSKKLNSATSKILSSIDQLDKRINSAFAGIEESTLTINSVATNQCKLVESVAMEFTSLVTNIKILNEEICMLKTKADTINNASISVKDFSERLNGYAKSIEAVGLNQFQIIDNISDHSVKLKEQLDKSRDYTNQVHQSLVTMTKNLTEKIEGL